MSESVTIIYALLATLAGQNFRRGYHTVEGGKREDDREISIKLSTNTRGITEIWKSTI